MPRMFDDRRHFHEHPRAFIRGIFDFGLYSIAVYIRSRSISDFDLYSTSVYIRSRLDSLGIACSGAGGAGLIAEIRGEEPSGRVTVLRADMDVLPIVEAGRPAYRSINEGVMHACRHDAHMASLPGTAAILLHLRTAFVFDIDEEALTVGSVFMAYLAMREVGISGVFPKT